MGLRADDVDEVDATISDDTVKLVTALAEIVVVLVPASGLF